ncbi:ABC transporter ATP-binding protein [Geobacter sulfurreducens]|nr:ABC transporter ATP-binding protein [Geobacter sulfurreducens]
MSNVISVENLGKKYLISHQGREPYTALRDVLANGARAFYRRLFSPGTSQADAQAEEFWALKDVSFEVKQGDRIGIIGRNGAGKSTLLKILSRITEPTEGRVRIRGRVASLLEVGTGFHPELTGRENIFLNGAILGMNRAEIARKFDEIVAFAEIEKFLDTPVKRYSSGMYVRLAFAVAAHLEPEILIVDEVLAVGDIQFQKKCLGKMEDVSNNEGRTILFVSHNMAAVQRMCQKALWFDNGSFKSTGPVKEVVSQYIQSNRNNMLLWKQKSKVRDKHAIILEVSIVDANSNSISSVTTGGSLRVKVVVEILRPNPFMQLSLALLDENGEVITDSSTLDDGISIGGKRGVFITEIIFPTDILLPRTYGIKAMLWIFQEGIVDCCDSLYFTAIETDSLCNSNPGGRPGLVAIKCHWQVNTESVIGL